jgi:hypothetical protein
VYVFGLSTQLRAAHADVLSAACGAQHTLLALRHPALELATAVVAAGANGAGQLGLAAGDFLDRRFYVLSHHCTRGRVVLGLAAHGDRAIVVQV